MIAGFASRVMTLAVDRPVHTLIAIGVVLLSCAPFAARLQLSLDSRALLPDTITGIREHDRVAALFRTTETVIVAITSDSSVYTPATAARLLRLTHAVAGLDGIRPASVRSLATITVADVGQTLSTRPLLPAAAASDPRLCARAQHDVTRLGLADGILASQDGRGWTIVASTAPHADGARLLEQLRQIAAAESTGGDRVWLGGTALAQIALGEAAAADLLRALPVAVLLLTLALAVRLGIVPAAIAIVEVGVSMLITAGIAGMLGVPLFITSLVLPVILLAVGVSDDVHAMEGIAASRDEDRESLSRVTRALLITAVTTIAGMASMGFATLRPLQTFGLLAAIALLCSSIMTLTLVPALHVLLKPVRTPVRNGAPRGRAHVRLPNGRGWGAVAVGLWLAVLPAAMVVALPRIHVNDSWVWNLPAAHDVAAGARVLDERFAGATTLEFAVNAGGPERWLQPDWFARLMRLSEAIGRDPSVGAVSSFGTDVLRARTLLGDPPVPELADTREAPGVLGRAELADAFTLLASRRDSRIEEQLDAASEQARLTLFVRRADHVTLERLTALVKARAAELQLSAEPFGEGWLSGEAVNRLVRDQVRSIGAALLFDALFIAAIFRSLRAGLAVLMPVLLAVATAGTALGVLGVSAGIANTMFLAIAIGVGTDFAVHMVCAYRQAERSGSAAPASAAIAMVRQPILASAAGLVSGFVALLAAEAPPTRELAAALLIVVVSAAAGSLVVVPRVLSLRVRGAVRSFQLTAHVNRAP